jgi:hypothetical protein
MVLLPLILPICGTDAIVLQPVNLYSEQAINRLSDFRELIKIISPK